MKLSPRERKIAIVVGAVVALFVGDQLLWEPYEQHRSQLQADLNKALDARDKMDDLLHQDVKNKSMWERMIKDGLTTDASAAESQMVHAIDDWGRDARLQVQSVKRDRTEQDKQFGRIVFRTTWTGDMAAVSRFLWDVQTTRLPARVTDLQITTRQGAKEGTDDLQLSCVVSTLVRGQVPATGPANNNNSASAGTVAAAGREVRP